MLNLFGRSQRVPDTTVMLRADIQKELSEGRLIVEPQLHGIEACHMDLRLDNYFGLFRSTGEAALDPGRNSSAIHFEEIPFFSAPFFMQPGSFVLAQTLEYVALPRTIVAHLDGRSSLGRRGLVVHATAGWIDPGFRGHITLELANLGAMPLALYPCMKIARLVFERISEAEGYEGQFQRQLRIVEPKVDRDCAAIGRFAASRQATGKDRLQSP